MNVKTVFDPSKFLNVESPEASYILGFLWADGSLGNDKNCFISLEIVSEDMNEIKSILDKTGKWNYYERQRYNWKPITHAKINNRYLYEFLVDCNYKEKSHRTAHEILKHIPNIYQHYFFRGLIDGDGSFYFNAKQYLRQFVLSSSYEQDWSYFTELLDSLNISYSLKLTERINKKGIMNKSSCLRITKKSCLLKLHNFIYSNYDGIGLPRKYKLSKLISS